MVNHAGGQCVYGLNLLYKAMTRANSYAKNHANNYLN